VLPSTVDGPASKWLPSGPTTVIVLKYSFTGRSNVRVTLLGPVARLAPFAGSLAVSTSCANAVPAPSSSASPATSQTSSCR